MIINTSFQKCEAEYKELKFRDEQSFKDWLKRKAEYIIKFKDNGQDCLEWFLDIGGEVLHANLQASIWNGHCVNLSKLKVGKEVETMKIVNDGETGNYKIEKTVYDFVVEVIIKLKKKKKYG